MGACMVVHGNAALGRAGNLFIGPVSLALRARLIFTRPLLVEIVQSILGTRPQCVCCFPCNIIIKLPFSEVWGSLADVTNFRAGHSVLRYSVAAAETGRGGTTGIAWQKRREDTSSGYPPHKPRLRQTGKRGLGRTAVRASRPLCPRPPRGTHGSKTGTEGAYATEQGGLLWLVGLAGLALVLAQCNCICTFEATNSVCNGMWDRPHTCCYLT